MKVAYFAGSLVKNLDGVSRVLYRISDYNKQNNIESVFISSDVDNRINNKTLSLTGVRLPFYKEYKFSLSSVSTVEKKLNEIDFHPDLIHLHSPCPAGLAGLKLAKKKNIPVVATYHTHFFAYLKYHHAEVLSSWVKRYMKYFYNQCDLVLVPSQKIKEELESFEIKNIQVLPHGVDNAVFSPAYLDKQLKEEQNGKQILLFVGRLVWEKNLQVLVDAINKLSTERDDFVVWIVGAGSAEKELKEKLPSSFFWGFCDGEKLSELYASSDIFVFPSSTETFGNVTLEAMASGVCCIVANARGSADLIQENETGLLFDPESSDELVYKIKQVMNNSEMRDSLAQNAYKSSSSYRWESILKDQLDKYELLVG